MSNEIQPGKYTARVLDYGVSVTQAGDPQVTVRFGWNDPNINAIGKQQTLIWNGSLKEGKAQEITLKALLCMGLRSDDKIETLADGLDSNLLDTERDLEIDVQLDTYNGKTRPRIMWINQLGGGKFRNAMSKDDFKVKLTGLNLKNNLKAIRHETGLTETKTTPDLPLPF